MWGADIEFGKDAGYLEGRIAANIGNKYDHAVLRKEKKQTLQAQLALSFSALFDRKSLILIIKAASEFRTLGYANWYRYLCFNQKPFDYLYNVLRLTKTIPV